MSEHHTAVFNNLCLKSPLNNRTTHHHQPLLLAVPPSADYEQKKQLNQRQNEAIKNKQLSLTRSSSSLSNNDITMKSKQKSLIEFYDSIPEYDDIHHLSNREFYKELENLREKQQFYRQYQTMPQDWTESYKKQAAGENPKSRPTLKPFCTTPILNTANHRDLIRTCSKPLSASRRSVRIESPQDNTPRRMRPKSRAYAMSSGTSSRDLDLGEWDGGGGLSISGDYDDGDVLVKSRSKSAPGSPVKSAAKPTVAWKDCGVTIPKPFQMTVRDEENKIVEEVLVAANNNKSEAAESATEKSDLFKAHPIPIESQIPLFDKIMADQERRNYIVRERSKAILQSQMRPFSFTKRDEEIQYLTKELSKSSPNIYFDDDNASSKANLNVKKFKAKPIPKNLFSNYIYRKMHEDEFYRTLQKRIRAEEMLRAASLPPSMAKREKTRPKFDVCPRSFKDLDCSNAEQRKGHKASKSGQKYRNQYEIKEFEELKNEFLYPNLKIKPTKRGKRTSRKSTQRTPSSSISSKTSDNNYSRTQSSLDLDSDVNRSNLAAVLRIQSARKRLETEINKRVDESKLKEEARWREKVMRRKPVWQTLAYSHEEDLAMRLQMRRDEEKLRSEEHRLRMELMLGRVNQQPTLFERQSTQINIYPKSKKKLIEEYNSLSSLKMRNERSISDLSDDTRTLDAVTKKDEAIQVFFDEKLKLCTSSDSSDSSKESLPEEKEECDGESPGIKGPTINN